MSDQPKISRRPLALALAMTFASVGTTARAADVEVWTPPAGNFAVKDSTGTLLRLLVNGTNGSLQIPGLPLTSLQANPVCFDSTGVLARCDLTLKALAAAVGKCGVDTRKFPIVIRLFGPAEEEARRIAAGLPGVRYLPHGASLADGVNAIVAAVRETTPGEQR